jgi:hypothetical protein
MPLSSQEQKDMLASGISRAIAQNYFLDESQARLISAVLGFVSADQVLRQQRILRNNPATTANWVQVAQTPVDPYLLPPGAGDIKKWMETPRV